MLFDLANYDRIETDFHLERMSITPNGLTLSKGLGIAFEADKFASFYLSKDKHSLVIKTSDSAGRDNVKVSCSKQGYVRIKDRNVINDLYSVLNMNDKNDWAKANGEFDHEQGLIFIDLSDKGVKKYHYKEKSTLIA